MLRKLKLSETAAGRMEFLKEDDIPSNGKKDNLFDETFRFFNSSFDSTIA